MGVGMGVGWREGQGLARSGNGSPTKKVPSFSADLTPHCGYVSEARISFVHSFAHSLLSSNITFSPPQGAAQCS